MSPPQTNHWMRFFFIIQGEGRGHMMQALALSGMLRRNGHELSTVVVGKSMERTIPKFFIEEIGTKVEQVDSPNFTTDSRNRSVRMGKSILVSLFSLGKHIRSIWSIDQLVRKDQPDVIINFYDFIGGLYNIIKSPKAKFICIAHQYLVDHSSFEFAKGRLFDRTSFHISNWLTSYGTDLRLALSFQKNSDEGMMVVPPLLRQKILDAERTYGNHLLVYLLNHGYAADIDQYHDQYPEEVIHCFWDNPDAPDELKIDETLTYHRLNGAKFVKFLASCKGYVTTAGFESVCEAMYLEKPVMMVPVEGHFEQACNALDATKAGAGISRKSFDLKKIIDYLPSHEGNSEEFRKWVSTAEAVYLEKLTT